MSWFRPVHVKESLARCHSSNLLLLPYEIQVLGSGALRSLTSFDNKQLASIFNMPVVELMRPPQGTPAAPLEIDVTCSLERTFGFLVVESPPSPSSPVACPPAATTGFISSSTFLQMMSEFFNVPLSSGVTSSGPPASSSRPVGSSVASSSRPVGPSAAASSSLKRTSPPGVGSLNKRARTSLLGSWLASPSASSTSDADGLSEKARGKRPVVYDPLPPPTRSPSASPPPIRPPPHLLRNRPLRIRDVPVVSASPVVPSLFPCVPLDLDKINVNIPLAGGNFMNVIKSFQQFGLSSRFIQILVRCLLHDLMASAPAEKKVINSSGGQRPHFHKRSSQKITQAEVLDQICLGHLPFDELFCVSPHTPVLSSSHCIISVRHCPST